MNFAILETASIPDVYDHYLEISEINGDITTKVMKKQRRQIILKLQCKKTECA